MHLREQCGDLVNAYPDNQDKQEAQARDFKDVSSRIDPRIPLVISATVAR